LSILNGFSKLFHCCKIPCNTSHHTFSVLLHYLAKVISLNFGKSDTVLLFELAMPAFIPPDLWPPNSPDLNPVDYKIRDIIQQRVYQSRVHNTDELKQRFLHVWHGIDQTIIDMPM